LGFTLVNGTIAIAHKALQTAMAKVKALTPRGTHKTLETNLNEINQWYVGWANYYSLTYYPQLRKIEAHIRRRLRSRLVYQQKRKKPLYYSLVKRGVPPKQAANAVFLNNRRWALSALRAVTRAYPMSIIVAQTYCVNV
jgi:hypothetical protein